MDPMDYLFHQVRGDVICQMDPMHYLLHQVGGDLSDAFHGFFLSNMVRMRVICQRYIMEYFLFLPGWQMCGLSDMYVPCIVFRFTRSADVWFVRYVCPMYCFLFHQVGGCA